MPQPYGPGGGVTGRLSDFELDVLLRHIRGLAARAEADGRSADAAWWRAQAERWARDPAEALTMQIRRELDLRGRVGGDSDDA